MIDNINRKGLVLRKEIDGIISKICSRCDTYYPDNVEYFNKSSNKGGSASACRKCQNKYRSFEGGKPIVNHWVGDLLICSTCKIPKNADEFGRDKKNKYRDFKANICKGCNNIKSQERLSNYSKENNLEYYLSRLYYGVSDRVRAEKWKSRFNDAEFKLLKNDLLELYIKQDGKCALTGIEMSYITGARKGVIYNNASIDRIDSSLGYEKRNIQLVCTIINLMKHTLSQEELLFYCTQIIKTQNKT